MLGGVLLLLLLAHLAGLFSKYALGHGHVFGLVPMFDLDEEGNIPTLYSSTLLLLSSVILAAFARAKRSRADRFALYWTGLSAIFLFLAVDEAASIHEVLIRLREAFETRGVLHFPWLIVYIPLVLLVAAVYLRFLAALPRRTAGLFLLAGALYVGGAAGVEMIGGVQASLYGEENLAYSLITTMEELLELSGLLVFIYALLSYAWESGSGSRILFCVGEESECEAAPLRRGTH